MHIRLTLIALPTRILPLILLATLALLVAFATPSLAQTQDLPAGITANDVNDVARQLWCPLCSGVRLDSCELKACDQMKDVIAIKLAEGESADSIEAYFLEQYGPQVLGEPPREGFNWLAWIMPFAVLAMGGGFLWSRARGMVSAQADLEAAPAQPAKQSARPDDYESVLEEELNRYG